MPVFFERDEANFTAIAGAYGEKFNEVEAQKTAKASIEKTLDSLIIEMDKNALHRIARFVPALFEFFQIVRD